MILKKLLFGVTVTSLYLLLAGGVYCQSPQTNDVANTQPLFRTNASWNNGVAPGYWPTCTNKGATTGCSGLTLYLGPGTAICGGGKVTYAGGTLVMTNNTTNYVKLDVTSSCAPSVSTSAFSGADTGVTIADVTTAGGVITVINDDRTPFMQISGGGGGGKDPGFAPTNGGGLILNLSASNAFCADGSVLSYSAGTKTMVNNTDNYVTFNPLLEPCSNGSVQNNTTSFAGQGFPIAKVHTSGGAITLITDYRFWWAAPNLSMPYTTKGELVLGVGSGDIGGLGIGADGQVLTAHSGSAVGADWETPNSNTVAPPINKHGQVISWGLSSTPASGNYRPFSGVNSGDSTGMPLFNGWLRNFAEYVPLGGLATDQTVSPFLFFNAPAAGSCSTYPLCNGYTLPMLAITPLATAQAVMQDVGTFYRTNFPIPMTLNFTQGSSLLSGFTVAMEHVTDDNTFMIGSIQEVSLTAGAAAAYAGIYCGKSLCNNKTSSENYNLMVAPFNMKITALAINSTSGAQGAGGSFQAQWRINKASSGPLVTVASGKACAEFTPCAATAAANVSSMNAGDLMDVQMLNNSATNGSLTVDSISALMIPLSPFDTFESRMMGGLMQQTVSTGTPKYCTVNTANCTTSLESARSPVARWQGGTAKNLYCVLATAQGAMTTTTVTLMKNGVDTILTGTIGASQTNAVAITMDTTHTVTFAQTDDWALHASTSGASPGVISSCSFEFRYP